MKKNLYFGIAFLFLLGTHTFAFEFKKNDKVVFIGNSITHGGTYHAVLRTFLATRYQKDITILNKGISGETASNILNRLDKDVLSEKPTVAFIKVGMNDVQRWLYSERPTESQIEAQKNALDLYKKKTEELIKKLLYYKIEVILITPTIYEESPLLKSKNEKGVNRALGVFADYIKAMGNQYKLEVVDFYSILNAIDQKVQAKDPTFTIVGPDRIHPGNTGHFVMGYQLIKAIQKQDTIVSELCINVAKKKSINAINCKSSNIEEKDGNLEFDLFENSLPMPLSDFDEKGQTLVPFSDDLNKEILQVEKLQKSKYKLFIDNEELGQFSSNELEKGIRLDKIFKTPQYKQAIKVNKISNEIKWYQGQIRDLRYVEYAQFKVDVSALSIDERKALAQNKLSESKDSKLSYQDYVNKMLNGYIDNIGNEKDINLKIDAATARMFETSKPVSHHYQLQQID